MMKLDAIKKTVESVATSCGISEVTIVRDEFIRGRLDNRLDKMDPHWLILDPMEGKSAFRLRVYDLGQIKWRGSRVAFAMLVHNAKDLFGACCVDESCGNIYWEYNYAVEDSANPDEPSELVIKILLGRMRESVDHIAHLLVTETLIEVGAARDLAERVSLEIFDES